jgi:hypothetical protein
VNGFIYLFGTMFLFAALVKKLSNSFRFVNGRVFRSRMDHKAMPAGGLPESAYWTARSGVACGPYET